MPASLRKKSGARINNSASVIFVDNTRQRVNYITTQSLTILCYLFLSFLSTLTEHPLFQTLASHRTIIVIIVIIIIFIIITNSC